MTSNNKSFLKNRKNEIFHPRQRGENVGEICQ